MTFPETLNSPFAGMSNTPNLHPRKVFNLSHVWLNVQNIVRIRLNADYNVINFLWTTGCLKTINIGFSLYCSGNNDPTKLRPYCFSFILNTKSFLCNIYGSRHINLQSLITKVDNATFGVNFGGTWYWYLKVCFPFCDLEDIVNSEIAKS